MTAEKEKRTARIVGALFIVAIVVSLMGGAFLESLLSGPDYLTEVAANETTVILGVLLELINGVAVIGIAVMMFPMLKKQDEALALGYVAVRTVEAVIIVAALIGPLTLLAMSQESSAGALGGSNYETVGDSIVSVRGYLVGQITGIFFSLGALLFYYLLYQSQLVPRFISIWGLIAVALVFSWNLLEFVGITISVGIVFGLPIILNELFLGVWLIAKGFSSPPTVSEPAEVAISEA